MKRIATLIATVALMLNIGVASAYAQRPVNVKMTFSGTNVATAINLQNNTVTDEIHLAGDGSLGQFTFRELHGDGAAPQPPSGCLGPYFGVLVGAGVFRFQDNSLLIVKVTDGSFGCINPVAGTAAITVNYQVMGGTGRLKSATGTLKLTSTLTVALFNAAGAPQLLTNTGEAEGTIYGVAKGEDGHNEQ
jgi:type 1 fimbria pilin